ncbi:MAG: hypothetical protein IAC69_01765 [Proteobacteria bacterium]|uniref:Glutaredoxin domain-containing protein n=1 Tax=Candidatus Enterousia avistercoris TaxID=2840788 RepID=A0A9D9DEG9_9PROT|nr:hypothetical protein [Candidatus Enterousia avistercoris]
MKKLSFLFALVGLAFTGAASAADITLYYSPYCPHCHHARDFFVNRIVYEYPDVRVVQVNVMDQKNLPQFQDVLKKCKYDSGGVPVIVVGDKCFQGYADFMQQELRDAVEVDMDAAAKDKAAENKKAMDTDPENFKSKHPDRQNAITEYNPDEQVAENEKKNDRTHSTIYFYALLVVLVVALGIVLVRKDKKKK